jgi:hypothetical protein
MWRGRPAGQEPLTKYLDRPAAAPPARLQADGIMIELKIIITTTSNRPINAR